MDKGRKLLIYAAPIQGVTELPWRHWHNVMFGTEIDAYHTPFLRVERGEVRRRDLRDLASELNVPGKTVPQIIFRNSDEFQMLVDSIAELGYDRIDLNMGCPFPPQVHHGRGAGMLENIEALNAVSRLMLTQYGNLHFSVKMRVGIKQPTDWHAAVGILNDMPLTHVTVHPRTAIQQYGGELHYDQFITLQDSMSHPIVFNGDIIAPKDIDEVVDRFPGIGGVMIGRGIINRPTIVKEWSEAKELDVKIRIDELLKLHDMIYDYYRDTMSGDLQILGKMRPLWDYAPEGVDRKILKGIKKSTTLRKYDDAIIPLRR